jgi:putative DNA primase/helicase
MTTERRDTEQVPTTLRFHLTDTGNGQRFALQHGQWARYCFERKSWLLWDGQRWAWDPGDGAMRLAKATARSIYEEAAGEASDERRGKIAAWAVRSESEKALRAMLALAQSEPGIPIRVDALDADGWLLNVDNGTLELKTSTLRPHRREDLITKLVPVAYDPEAGCPRWHAMLDRIFDGRRAVIDFMQRGLGYALTGETIEQVIFLLWGAGANGKTTFLTTAETLLGDYALSTRPETLMARKGDGIPNDVARLKGARLVIAVEADAGQRLAEGLVKAMTGQDTLSARFLHQEFFEFTPTFKIMIGTNYRPAIRDTSHAMWRRVRLVPFTVTIPDGEQDRHLVETLRGEWAGILAWAVQGCLEWQRAGLGCPEEVRAATEEYRTEMDILGAFLTEKCVRDPAAQIGARDLYQSYEAWAHQGGERKPLTEKTFSMRLKERGLEKKSTGPGNVWLALRLRGSADDLPVWVTETAQ